MKTVYAYLMRHGEKDPGEKDNLKAKMTSLGREQVRRSAHKHLSSVRFSRVLSSGLPRTDETAELALKESADSGLAVHLDQNFGFEWASRRGCLEDDATFSEVCAKLAKLPFDQQSVELWLKEWPAARVLRGQVNAALMYHAQQLPNGANFFAASHSPTAELAAVNPQAIHRLWEADIVKYTVTQEKVGAPYYVVETEYLYAPTSPLP